MNSAVIFFVLLIFFLGALVMTSLFYSAIRYVPFVPTEVYVMKKMIAAAELKDGQRVFDLGCGDGRLLIEAMRKKHVKATGVEVNRLISWLARFRLWMNRKKAKIICGNFFQTPLRESDVIFCYLFPRVMQQLKEKFEAELKKGTTIVSYCFPIKAWKPTRVITTRASKPHNFLIYVYHTPCQKA